MEEQITFSDFRRLIEYFKTFGFTKEGRKYWYEQNKERLRNNDGRLVEELKENLLGDFVLSEAKKVQIDISSNQIDEYLTPELQRLADDEFLDYIAWLSGTGRYRQ